MQRGGDLRMMNSARKKEGKPTTAAQNRLTERICFGLLLILIIAYVVAYSSKSISAYATGNTLFDLATFEQGFWNATKGTLFFYSLEGEMSRFGRHFSPIFIPMVPIYALHRDPSTILVFQSLALGIAAIPLYLFARSRLSNSPVALIVSALYLANPAVHDVNIVNEFHEIAFAVPLLFLAFYAVEKSRWRLYGGAIIGTLMVKEEIALTVAALGIYVLLFKKQRRIGWATIIGSLIWLVLVTEIIMPWLRGPYGPVPFPGYDYLGDGVLGIAKGIFTKPDELLNVMLAQPKQDYMYWLLLPVGFLPIIAPDAFLIAFPALLEILASTFPPTYQIFERYVAPIIPIVFIATVISVGRIQRILDRMKLSAVVRSAILILLSVGIGWTTVQAQTSRHKYPTVLFYPMQPEAHAANAIKFTEAIPEKASVVVEDHRWLARLSHREYLYFLSGESPQAEYLLLDRKIPPVTNVQDDVRKKAIDRIVGNPDYLGLRCEDGLSLYVRKDAYGRDGDLLSPYQWDHDREDNFNNVIRLKGYSFEPSVIRPSEKVTITLYWQAQDNIRADYTVFVQVLDKQQHSVGQQDSRPQNGACTTLGWATGEIVQDAHSLTISPTAPAGEYEVHVGFYTLADMKRLELLGQDGKVIDNSISIPVVIR